MGIRAGPPGARSGEPDFRAAGSGIGLEVIGTIGIGLRVIGLGFPGQPDISPIFFTYSYLCPVGQFAEKG